MEVQRQLSAHGREAIAHYRRRSPDGERARDNWTAIERKLAAGAFIDEGDVDGDLDGGADDEGGLEDLEDVDDLDGAPANDRRSGTGRLLTAVGTSVAIAAAVLLLMRATFVGVTALSEEARTIPSQAMDAESQGDEARTWKGRSPKRSSPKARTTREPVPVADTTPTEPVAPAPAVTDNATPRPTSPADTEAGPEPTPAPTLAEETKILGQARAALSAGRYDDAATVARDYQHRFAKGAFVEELHAIHAIASCKQGVGGDPLAAFEARHPGSPLLPRVQSGCEVAQ